MAIMDLSNLGKEPRKPQEPAILTEIAAAHEEMVTAINTIINNQNALKAEVDELRSRLENLERLGCDKACQCGRGGDCGPMA